MFFLYANFQLSQKCHFYQLLWDTPFQECFWSRLINCCLFIKHYILNIDITRQLTFFRCFQLLEKEPRAETVLDIKEAIAPVSETMLSFRDLDGTDPRLWKWTVHLENKVCFLKILTHGEVITMFIIARWLSLGFYTRLILPARCGVDLSQKLVTWWKTRRLGVMLDRNLSWNDHIDCIGRKISAKLGMIRKASKVIPRESCLTRYNALILPVFDYCAARMGQLVIQFIFQAITSISFPEIKKKYQSFVNSKRDKVFLCCVKWMYHLILDVNEFLDTNYVYVWLCITTVYV